MLLICNLNFIQFQDTCMYDQHKKKERQRYKKIYMYKEIRDFILMTTTNTVLIFNL